MVQEFCLNCHPIDSEASRPMKSTGQTGERVKVLEKIWHPKMVPGVQGGSLYARKQMSMSKEPTVRLSST